MRTVRNCPHPPPNTEGFAGELSATVRISPDEADAEGLASNCPHREVISQDGLTEKCGQCGQFSLLVRACGSSLKRYVREETARREFPEKPSNRPQPSASLDPRGLLRALAELGILVRPDGDALHVSAPSGRLTPELRATLAQAKASVLAYLRTYPCTDCGREYGFRSPTRCFWCREAADPGTSCRTAAAHHPMPAAS